MSFILNLFKEWGANEDLSLKQITLKLATLLLLVTGRRGQQIINLDINGLEFKEVVIFKMFKLMKHNRPGDPLDTILIRAFPEDKRLCVVEVLKVYLKRTELVREFSQLLLSYISPHNPIERGSLARWTLATMRLAGIDTTEYGAHSTRGAAASAAKAVGLNVNLILKNAGWKGEDSFARFYDKRVE